jgi:mediator of RNA polymerase II transcription subunit 17
MNRMFDKLCVVFHTFRDILMLDIFSKQSSTSVLGEKLRRIFIERGFDFFEKQKGAQLGGRVVVSGEPEKVNDASDPAKSEGNPATKIMSTDELFNMRMEILPQLL